MQYLEEWNNGKME